MKEAIELLEDSKMAGNTHLLPNVSYYAVNPEKFDQALDILKDNLRQQPQEEGFTKAVRSFVKLYENERPRRAEITFLGEALEIIDKLSQQPPEGEFTKDVREKLTINPCETTECRLNTTKQECIECLENGICDMKKDLEKACDIIDKLSKK